MSTATIAAAATHYSRRHWLAVTIVVAILAAAGITLAIIALTNSGSSQPAAGTRVVSVAAGPLSFGRYSEPRAPFTRASAPVLEGYVEPTAPFATVAALGYVEPRAPFATVAALGYVEPRAPFATKN
jgi:hypothetical protein